MISVFCLFFALIFRALNCSMNLFDVSNESDASRTRFLFPSSILQQCGREKNCKLLASNLVYNLAFPFSSSVKLTDYHSIVNWWQETVKWEQEVEKNPREMWNNICITRFILLSQWLWFTRSSIISLIYNQPNIQPCFNRNDEKWNKFEIVI